MIWAGRSLFNVVSALQLPLCITFVPMKMNFPFCFYLSTSFAEAVCGTLSDLSFFSDPEPNVHLSDSVESYAKR